MVTKNKPKSEYIFIDACSYLFYFDSIVPLKNIKALEELHNLFNVKKIKILSSQQVRDEYKRCRKDKIKWIKGEIGKSIDNLKLRPLEPDEDVKNKLDKVEKEIEKHTRDLMEKYKKSIDRADEIIMKILEKSEDIPEGEEIFKNAFFRSLKGNPPFDSKNDRREGDKYKYGDKYGDFIIWESLLSFFRKKEDKLIIISKDTGWYNTNEKEDLNDFLTEEWTNKTDSKKIASFLTITDFIEKFSDKKEVVKKDEAKKEKEIAGRSFGNYYPLSNSITISGINSTPYITTGNSPYSASGLGSITIPGNMLSGDMITGSYGLNIGNSLTLSKNKYTCPNIDCGKDITNAVDDFIRSEYLGQMNNFGMSHYKTSLFCPHCKKQIL